MGLMDRDYWKKRDTEDDSAKRARLTAQLSKLKVQPPMGITRPEEEKERRTNALREKLQRAWPTTPAIKHPQPRVSALLIFWSVLFAIVFALFKVYLP